MGMKGGGETQAQKLAAQRQAEELTRLKEEEKKRVAAAARRTQGRASLISGAETGIEKRDTLG